MSENESKNEPISTEDDDKMKRRVTFHNRCLSNISSAGLTVHVPGNPSSPTMPMASPRLNSPTSPIFNYDESAGTAIPDGYTPCKCKNFERHHWKPVCKNCFHAESCHEP